MSDETGHCCLATPTCGCPHPTCMSSTQCRLLLVPMACLQLCLSGATIACFFVKACLHACKHVGGRKLCCYTISDTPLRDHVPGRFKHFPCSPALPCPPCPALPLTCLGKSFPSACMQTCPLGCKVMLLALTPFIGLIPP